MGKTWKCFLCDSDTFTSLCDDCGVMHNKFKHGRKSASSSSKRGVIHPDISNGLEKIKIPVINDVDNCPPPSDFTYIVQNVLGTGVNLINRNPNFITCCSCKDNCSDPKVCECAIAMAGFAYDRNNSYFSDKPGGVYECNYLCSCHQDLCHNRLVGNGPHKPLEVFRCAETGKGWGVRCSVDMPIGTFIADYLGEVLNEADAEARVTADEYLFGLDAFARSHACQVLTDVGLKKIELPAPELVCDVDGISHGGMERLLGKDIADRVFNRPKVTPLIDYEVQDSKMVIHDKRQKLSANSTYLDTIRSAGSRKRDIDRLLGSPLTKAVSSSDLAKEDSSTHRSATRKKRMREARITLMERAMVESETKNNSYTLDAK